MKWKNYIVKILKVRNKSTCLTCILRFTKAAVRIYSVKKVFWKFFCKFYWKATIPGYIYAYKTLQAIDQILLPLTKNSRFWFWPTWRLFFWNVTLSELRSGLFPKTWSIFYIFRILKIGNLFIPAVNLVLFWGVWPV